MTHTARVFWCYWSPSYGKRAGWPEVAIRRTPDGWTTGRLSWQIGEGDYPCCMRDDEILFVLDTLSIREIVSGASPVETSATISKGATSPS